MAEPAGPRPREEPEGHVRARSRILFAVTAIRAATPADAQVLAQLRFEFRAGESPATEDEESFIARCLPWMRSRLAQPGPWQAWVAEAPGTVTGNLWLQLIEKIPNPAAELETHAYITNVYVRPAARGTGIGAMLVETAMRWCREQGVDSVVLWPSERSRTLYQRHGFAVRDDLLEAVLDPGRGSAKARP